MNRVTLVRDLTGQETLYQAKDYPLVIGGREGAIAIPEAPEPAAYIGLHQGHAFVQSAEDPGEVWLNDERLEGSAWLKSDDRLQIGSTLVIWRVQGERVSVTVTPAKPAPVSSAQLTPPANPPPPPEIESAPTSAASIAKPPSSLRWLLGLAFALLLLAAGFLLSSASVILEIEPEPTRFSLQGFPPILQLSDRALALPGDYTLLATRAGYRELKAPIQVRFRENQRRNFRLEKLPGRLNLSSTPAQARVFIDGELRGETPLTELPVAAGAHRLRLEAPLHLPVEQPLEVPGMDQLQELELHLTPNWAEITVTSLPEGAQVSEGGEILGMTPLSIPMEAGHHRLELQRDAYKTRPLEFHVEAGQPQTLPVIQLQKKEVILHLNSQPAGATVTVAGRFQGLTPLQLQLAPDKPHRIRIAKAGYLPQKREVTLEMNQERRLEIPLSPQYGTLFISARPADAQVSIDGKPRGNALTRLRLTTRPHRLEITKPGYKPYRSRVTPRAGISQTLEVALTPIDSSPATIDPQTDRLTTASGQTLKRVTPSGSFMMGASRREPGRRANESLRRVQLTRPYYIGVKEVSNREYRLFAPGHDSGRFGGFSLDTDDQPASKVGWNDTARYLNWLSKQDNLPMAYEEKGGKMQLIRPVTTGYRLPTEAEWAYAARYAERNQPAQYPWGARQFPPPRVQGNYADDRAQSLLPIVIEGYDDGHPVSAPVGSFAPNPAGLHDMDGNVAEWCLDYYSVYAGSSKQLSKDPLGGERGRHHLIRGSSWRNGSITELRLSYRDYSDKPRDDLGFRIARYAK